MVNSWPLLKRCFIGVLFIICGYAPLCGQGLPAPEKLGAVTLPYTVVYKLKNVDSNTSSDLQLRYKEKFSGTLQQIGAKNIKQKFPHTSAAVSSKRPQSVDLSRIYEIQYNPNQSFEQVKKTIMATGLVEYVEPVYKREPFYQPNDPNADSLKMDQYYLKLIRAYGGWAVEKGDTNVVIGILDTGFRLSHRELKSKVKYNYKDPVDGIDNDGDGLIDNFAGWDFADRDNNVFDDTPYKEHGTQVAGAAVAATDNGFGIAGVGFNLKFMPLKVFPSTPQGSFAGFEAIVYAADMGCSVINLSWGGFFYSQYEQDIINYAVLNKNVVIVAAAGNTKGNFNIYPASYDNVLSVGGTDQNDVKYPDFTHSYLMDICAPSAAILTTNSANDNSFKNTWGTSLAAPMASGAAGLVRSKYPHLTALQVMERVRVTSDDIYHLSGNSTFRDMLGKGRLNVKRALKEVNPKSVRATSFSVRDNKVAQTGDTILLDIDFTNFLSPVQNLVVEVSSPSPFISFLQPNIPIGSMNTLATVQPRSTPVKFVLSPFTPINHEAYFRLTFQDGSYQDFQYIRLLVNPDFITLNTGKLRVTVNNKGNFGYNGHSFNQGTGFRYKDSNSLVSEAGLLIASEPGRISDNIRNAELKLDNDFRTISPIRMHYNDPQADQATLGIFKDKYPDPAVVGVEVKHKAFAWQTQGEQDFIILEYNLKNITSDTLKTVHAGLFADWDIGNAYQNLADWDENLRLGYAYSVYGAFPYAGIKLLTPDTPLYHAIDNTGGLDAIALSDGFSNADKYTALSNGVSRKRAGNNGIGNDISHVIGATAHNLPPGETKTVAFALVAGDNFEDLKIHALAAQQKYISIKTGPLPLVRNDTLCLGNSVTVAPTGGTRYNFYADQNKEIRLASGNQYSITSLSQNMTLYVSNSDSLFESALVPVQLIVAEKPIARFTTQKDKLYSGYDIAFINDSRNGYSWLWDFGTGETSTKKSPAYTFKTPGSYLIKLKITDRFGCSDSVSSSLKISEDPLADQFIVYPNPTTGVLKVKVPVYITEIASSPPQIVISDRLGRTSIPTFTRLNKNEIELDLSYLPDGVYYARIQYRDAITTKKIILLKP